MWCYFRNICRYQQRRRRRHHHHWPLSMHNLEGHIRGSIFRRFSKMTGYLTHVQYCRRYIYWHDLEWFEWTLIEKLGDIWPMCVAVKNGEYRAFLPKLHKDQINVWFGSHCFELSSSPLLRVWLAFVSAMIVCYLKPKLRARVVLLLVTILVTAMRSIVCSYCDTAFFPAQCACNRFFSANVSAQFQPSSLFCGYFSFQQYHHFFCIVLVICTCFTTRMGSSLLINDFLCYSPACSRPSLQ